MYQPCLADLDDEVRIDHLSGVCNKLRDTCVRHRRVTAERENYDFLAFVPGKKIWGPLVVERLIRSPLLLYQWLPEYYLLLRLSSGNVQHELQR